MVTRPRSSHSSDSALELPPIIHLWLLRLLVPLGIQRSFIRRDGFGNDSLAEIIGLGEWIEPTTRKFDPSLVRVELRRLHAAAEHKASKLLVSHCLSRNVERLKGLVSLSETDCRVLEFAVLINSERILDDLADELGPLSSFKAFRALSVLLKIPERDIRSALSAQGILTRSGLVSINRDRSTLLCGKLKLLSDNFADAICSSDADPVSLLRDTVALSSAPLLNIEDYAHINPSLAVLRPYLGQAITTRRKGVNIFLHGRPGTGKSQLAKVLSKELGCELFEVASEDNDGDPIGGETRLRAFRAAQNFLSQRRAVILFDEVEDVFNDGDSFFGRKSTAQTRKGWINRMLEDNAVPTLWLSNRVDGVDPAFIRRFDMVIEVPVPPKKQRERILIDTCTGLISPQSMSRIATSEALAPAVVTRAASVVRSIHQELGEAGAGRALELLINNTLQAQGHRPLRAHDPDQLPGVYDPAFIHSDADLKEVGAGLLQSRSGRLCLYGPPGTGKSAFARWLADQIGVPLCAKRTSDLISKWVGESEKNIASAFHQAEQDGALLLLDEVDSFLQDRSDAQRSWELTLVNEMLTQMESFPGVFVASTNLMDGLDPAALRRFDLKVKFDFLTCSQATELLRRYCIELALPPPNGMQLSQLSRLQCLTPGDFATVARQHKFRPIVSSTALVTALESECVLKTGVKRAIGFCWP